jgi:hypothetical protein
LFEIESYHSSDLQKPDFVSAEPVNQSQGVIEEISEESAHKSSVEIKAV